MLSLGHADRITRGERRVQLARIDASTCASRNPGSLDSGSLRSG
jgi:hypothetical protein